jgi:hypothetical protein
VVGRYRLTVWKAVLKAPAVSALETVTSSIAYNDCFQFQLEPLHSGAHSICLFAARGGHLDVLRWARDRSCPWSEATCCYAAEGGHLEVLRWAREHHCPWDGRTCAWAAKHGHLEVLRWAREHDCSWDAMTCMYAARNGHLEVLQWARAHGCPWNKEHCVLVAISQSHPETLAWVRAQP